MSIKKSIDVQELLQRYAAGERNFSETNVEASDEVYQADLREINLSDSTFDEVFMEGSNLSGANLRGARFGQTCLRNVDLSGADLTGADLTWSNLNGANLSNAKLNNACLNHVSMWGANLTDVNLSGAEFEINSEMMKGSIFLRTIMPDGTILSGSI